LIGTTVFGIAWLGIARTEEVVVATGKLEPVGNVKEVRVPWRSRGGKDLGKKR
jgi:HlyD family secretion protein